eukprot:gnl/TRDRNA2_/TRDRNA2_133765_c1_seq2.p1 gnl/TRDRNA2_/TRDRNA2_133765_c1~~gnl/TRDRNA2_/TRDRNA2_133765_c1_seq2.p1  ORF type:complete len:202 (+),score=33.45 gnl/TRDRNA2_/TRDRNA2_133765_c1_seq2:108-713(+)
MIPPSLRSRMNGLMFPQTGPCRFYTLVHGFDTSSAEAPYDVSNTSCAGSWAAGNIVMPAKAAAEWARGLYGPEYEVVPKELVQEMIPKENRFYGLATMNMSFISGVPGKYGEAVGHLGDTYGFTSIMAYFPALDVGFAVALNHEGMSQGGPSAVVCTTYNRLMDILLKKPLRNCSYVQSSYYFGKCVCKDELKVDDTAVLV